MVENQKSEQGGDGDEPYTSIDRRHTTRVVLISIGAAVGGFIFGFDSSVINGAINAVTDQFALSAAVTGFVVAISLLGAAVGAWFGGPVANKWGRTRVMLLVGILFLAGSVGSAFAFSAWDLAAWRVIGGLSIGAASAIVPSYISEISPAKLRGRLTSLQQMAIVLGIFVALLMDDVLTGASGGAGAEFWWGLETWRWMFLAGVVPAVVYGALALRLPESPRMLVSNGDSDKAIEVLKHVHGRSESETKTLVDSIRKSIRSDSKPSFKDLRGGTLGLVPIVWVGVIIAAFQQLVGINVIFYYSNSLWRSVGFSADFASNASVITAITNVVITVVAIFLIDKLGRRPLLLIGSSGMTISLVLMAISFTQASIVNGQPELPEPWGPVALVAANAFVVSFAVSWGPVMWTLLGEMFPNQIRGLAVGIATAVNWLANFAVTVTFPALSQMSLPFTYSMYAFFALASLVFVFFKVPETKNIPLEKMSDRYKRERRKAGKSTSGSSDGSSGSSGKAEARG
ncbi:sugar porter family MFS transporter [Arthrobacter terrae]|uniref:sugar porter family MFS transporter n=1 Tax=Arthrobacter terrae TaxID=2935737 RepID=UPI0028AEEFE8|nr:sugar porter family MFS transporter [Arthrobacter terrae]